MSVGGVKKCWGDMEKCGGGVSKSVGLRGSISDSCGIVTINHRA